MRTTAQRAADTASQYLQPGEQIVVSGFGELGHVSFLRKFLNELISELLTLGMISRKVEARRVHYVLTSRRLLALDGDRPLRGPGKLLLDLPLPSAKVIETKQGIFGDLKVDLAIDGRPKPLRVTFSSLHRQAGAQVVEAIGG